MSLADHLERLIHPLDSHQKALQNELDELERWAAEVKPISKGSTSARVQTRTLESPAVERLRELRNTTIDPQEQVEEDLDDITAHPQFTKHRTKLINLLSSGQSDADVSNTIAELVGYVELDFVMRLVAARHALVSKGFDSAKPRKVEPKSKKGKGKHDHQDFSEEAAKRRMAESFRNAAERPLFSGTAHPEAEALPHVYTSSSMTHNHSISSFGTKYLLPLGTTRRYTEDYEEVTLPPAKIVPPRATERLVPCSELPPLAKGSFQGYSSLNRIQSIVFPTAFKTNENMLICAPTGAGKTDVAMLTILRAIDQHRDHQMSDIASSIRRNDFKIIYVAPMKALAAEIVRKLGKRLGWLRIKVRELTGDMQLTKAEIAETQIIVTTPEKWDVVTRKPTGEGELATKVKLLIIDEVHLLNDERGAVIETIVARTIRQVESTQALIRIVGLSATLPNYIDVADFLRVSRTQGLFFFDSSFRPVPLEQHFLGVKGKAGSPAAKRALDKTAYHVVSELVREGHQVMVFVHSRKDTVKSAESLKELATLEGELDIFGCQEDPKFEFYRRDIGMSKNKEMKQLFDHGFGIHHAGMLRNDRNLMERLFESKVIKVLCCTATLAWGVNLPAHGVLIKGTQLYDPSQGKFVDLSVLDVLQIFGRAGRPGMESSGVGYICTAEDKLQHYLEAVTAQHPIESKFIHGILDSLNAEIALGTVTNVAEGAEWLGYTYLFVRMRKNPMVYGMTHEDPVNDPDLIERRHSMITIAAKKLAEVGMIRFDENKGGFSITDIGRIAAKFYVRYASIEVFKKEFRPKMTEADVLALLSKSTEFEQIQVRENEVEELKALEQDMPCEVKGGTDSSAGKVNILLQAYISKRQVEDFALVSDTMYAAQNGGRIIRALLEIALSRKWANASVTLMAMSKSVEKRIWGFDHPLKQFDLSAEVLYNLGRWADDMEVYELASMSAAELGQLIHLNEKHGAALLRAAKQLPSVILSAKLRPLSHELLLISIDAERGFEWSSKLHGGGEPFWIWVEDDSSNILQLVRVNFTQNTKSLPITFIIPVPQPLPPSVVLRAISDRWIGAEEEVVLGLEDLVMPSFSTRKAHIMDLPLLRTDLKMFQPSTRLAFKQFIQFNSIQTQCVWSTYNTARNLLICASASSGKSLLGQLAICQTLDKYRKSRWVLVVFPRLDSARSMLYRLRDALNLKVDLAQHPRDLDRRSSPVCLTTPRCLLEWIGKPSPVLDSLGLVVLEDLELLDATYEMAISSLLHRTQSKPVRIIGLSAALNNSESLAEWLGVPEEGTYCFPPTERDQAVSITFQTFTIPYSAALMKAMAKPVYDTIRANSRDEASIVFVPSISQCNGVIADLITQCTLAMNLRGFLGSDVSQDLLEGYVSQMKNGDQKDGLMQGIGVWHERMDISDRTLVLRLFADEVIKVLVVPREACWTIPVRAGLVVVMGTQYVVRHAAPGPESDVKYERQVVDYTNYELVRMEGRAVRHGKTGRLHVLCQSEHRDIYMRFLTDGLPLESQLLDAQEANEVAASALVNWIKEQRERGVKQRQDVLDFLSGTLFCRRITQNPSYYDVDASPPMYLSRLVDKLWQRSEPGVASISV